MKHAKKLKKKNSTKLFFSKNPFWGYWRGQKKTRKGGRKNRRPIYTASVHTRSARRAFSWWIMYIARLRHKTSVPAAHKAGRALCDAAWYTLDGGLIGNTTLLWFVWVAGRTFCSGKKKFFLAIFPCLGVFCGIKTGGGGTHLLLALVIWPSTTHPFRDGAPFLLLIETSPTIGRSLRCFHILHTVEKKCWSYPLPAWPPVATIYRLR